MILQIEITEADVREATNTMLVVEQYKDTQWLYGDFVKSKLITKLGEKVYKELERQL